MSDLISRQAAIDVAKQHWYKPDIAKALEELPSAQPEVRTQMSSADCISRQDVIKAVLGSNFSACTVYGRSEEGMATAKEIIQTIKNLPSAHPLDPCETCVYKSKGWDEAPCNNCTGESSKYEPELT